MPILEEVETRWEIAVIKTFSIDFAIVFVYVYSLGTLVRFRTKRQGELGLFVIRKRCVSTDDILPRVEVGQIKIHAGHRQLFEILCQTQQFRVSMSLALLAVVRLDFQARGQVESKIARQII